MSLPSNDASHRAGLEPPLVSCIVPVFNGEKYIREALDSIFAQTYRPIEVIVADDGSTDSTAAVVASYGSRILYRKQDNRGPAEARKPASHVIAKCLLAF